MTIEALNAKIRAATGCYSPRLEELCYLRDERLGMLGCHAGQEPAPEQIAIVDAQLFPPEAQGALL